MRPFLALLPLIALAACIEQDAIEALPDTDTAPITDAELDPTLEANIHPVDAEPTLDANTDNAPTTASFRWDPLFGIIDLDGKLNGTEVTVSEADGWISRAAGAGMAGLGGGYGRGYAKRGGMPLSAPMPEMDYAMEAEGVALDDIGTGGMVGGPVDLGAPTSQAPLKAATTDDNADYDAFLAFLDTWKGKPGVAGNAEEIDVRDRRFVTVVDDAGNAVPGAQITITDRAADKLVWSGTTFGDGKAPFYPHLAGYDGAQGDWLVQAHVDGEIGTVRWNGKSDEVAVTLSEVERAHTVKLDVVFLIDTTGSMADEIARVKGTLLSVTEKVNGLGTEVDLQYGAVLYRDIGDEYLTRHTPLTADIAGFDQMLQGIQANGGGDGPESLNQGLSVAVSEMEWRPDAAKRVFLVADAPPHMDYQDDATYGRAALTAMTNGIRIHTVAASGLDDFGSLVFRQSAQLARGKFIFIEYGSTAASAADHGVTGTVESNNLDAILFREIRDEVEGWGRVSA